MIIARPEQKAAPACMQQAGGREKALMGGNEEQPAKALRLATAPTRPHVVTRIRARGLGLPELSTPRRARGTSPKLPPPSRPNPNPATPRELTRAGRQEMVTGCTNATFRNERGAPLGMRGGGRMEGGEWTERGEGEIRRRGGGKGWSA